MEATSKKSLIGGLAGAPYNVDQMSGTDTSSSHGQPGNGAFISSPSADPRAQTPKVYTVQGNDPKTRMFVDNFVMQEIIRQGTDSFVGANYYTKSIAPHHLVVHNQRQLDFVNWQIENAYIGKEKLECLELFFKPKDIESLPISLTKLKLNCLIDLAGLKKTLEHLPKLEEIELVEMCEGFIHKHPLLLSKLKKICINNYAFYPTLKDQNAFLSLVVNNKNLHTLQIRSRFDLPRGGAEVLARSNIHTLEFTPADCSTANPEYIDDYKVLLGSETLKNLTLTCGGFHKLTQRLSNLDQPLLHLSMLKKEIEDCKINTLDLRDDLFPFYIGPYALLSDSRRSVGEKKINLFLDEPSLREELEWILEPKLFQDISIAFGIDLNVSEEFFKLLIVHPGRVGVYLHALSPERRRQELSTRISECRTLDTLKVHGWDRSDFEKLVAHPKLATLILDCSKADVGLELLAGIPFLNSLYLGAGLTAEKLKGLENNRTIKKIGLEYAALTEGIAKSLLKVVHLSTVDLRRIHLKPGDNRRREEVSALQILLSAPSITKVYVPSSLRDVFGDPKLAELLRNSSAGRVEFWSDHSREHGPELPPPTTTVVLNPQLLA